MMISVIQKLDDDFCKPNPYRERRDGRLHLKKDHNYTYQIQKNLAIKWKKKELLHCFDDRGSAGEEIEFNREMWETMLPSMAEFN